MKRINVAGAVLLATLIVACNNVDFKKTKGGMPYKIIPGNGTVKAQNGNILKLHVSTRIKDSTYFTTYGKEPVYLPVSENILPYDISEVLPLLKKGDSVYTVQAMDTFMKRNPGSVAPNFKKGDKIITTLKVLEIFKNQEEYQKDAMVMRDKKVREEEITVKNYLAKNNITAQRTRSGAYVQILDPGQGPQADSGKYVTVMYRGSTFGNKVFDTNMDTTFGHTEPLGYVVGSGRSIAGFDEGIQLLKKGAKANIYIPSMLGYGPQPPPNSGIQPFEHLIFNIQVVDITNQPPRQQTFTEPGIDTTGR